tara:strand:+ start:6047 stop:6250 length:204 start_codon:yes stop_codon:yes gene_type:complete
MFTDVKSIFASKTFWFNIVGFCVMLAEALMDFLPPDWTPVLGVVVTVGNVLLRFKTNSAIALIPPKR